ncbi:MAG: hypothetical protein KIT31_25530 [Deltaproteobacteria bacterium]|nr:hypothetical protein [Deltaproteobacteria bacterium]
MRALPCVLVIGCGGQAAAPQKQPADDPPPAGTVAGKVALGDAPAVHLAGRAVPLERLPMTDLIGLPMSGLADFTIDIDVPPRDYSKATGTAAFSCAPCRLGADGTTLANGIAVGHIELDRVEARAEIGDGRARLVAWQLASKELAIDLVLELELRPALADAVVTGCLRYRVLPPLAQRDPGIGSLITLAGGTVGDDGMASLVMSGKLSAVRLAAGACSTKR